MSVLLIIQAEKIYYSSSAPPIYYSSSAPRAPRVSGQKVVSTLPIIGPNTVIDVTTLSIPKIFKCQSTPASRSASQATEDNDSDAFTINERSFGEHPPPPPPPPTQSPTKELQYEPIQNDRQYVDNIPYPEAP